MTREDILKSIQRLAKEKGKTPSEKDFYAYAAIGIYDLKKNGWAFYGELVNEAELPPNKFDKTKYSHNELCEMFIEVIREKNKWPQRGVLDVKHHKDPNFPDSSTFYKKLGLTGDLAKTILEYIDDKKEYDDVIQICKAILVKFDIDDSKSKAGDKIGFVYLYKMGKVYKIGKTYNPIRREGELEIQLPEKAEPIHNIKTDDPSGIEAYWHKRFESKRKNGEWFNLDNRDIKAFMSWKHIY